MKLQKLLWKIKKQFWRIFSSPETPQLTEQERKQLQKQAFFDLGSSAVLTVLSFFLAPEMPLVGGAIFVPLQKFGYTVNPVLGLGLTAAATGWMGVQRLMQSLPTNQPNTR